MDIEQLEYFRKTAMTENITKAAEALYITQPSLSLAIRRLEKELGCQLFDRIGRSIRLNSSGRLFLEYVCSALDDIEEGKRRIRELNRQQSMHISILVHPTISQQLLIEKMLDKFPQAVLYVASARYNMMRQQLLARETDFVISNVPFDGKEFNCVTLRKTELVLILPEKHPLAGAGEAPLVRFQNEQFATDVLASQMYKKLEELCRNSGFRPKVGFEATTFDGLFGAVRSGSFVALLPIDALKGRDTSGIRYLHITEPCCEMQICLSWLREKSPRALTENIRDYLVDAFSSDQIRPRIFI